MSLGSDEFRAHLELSAATEIGARPGGRPSSSCTAAASTPTPGIWCAGLLVALREFLDETATGG